MRYPGGKGQAGIYQRIINGGGARAGPIAAGDARSRNTAPIAGCDDERSLIVRSAGADVAPCTRLGARRRRLQAMLKVRL